MLTAKGKFQIRQKLRPGEETQNLSFGSVLLPLSSFAALLRFIFEYLMISSKEISILTPEFLCCLSFVFPLPSSSEESELEITIIFRSAVTTFFPLFNLPLMAEQMNLVVSSLLHSARVHD